MHETGKGSKERSCSTPPKQEGLLFTPPRKTNLTQAPPSKKYLRWTAPWAALYLSRRVSEGVVAQSCQWEPSCLGVSPGDSAQGRCGARLQPLPSRRAGRQLFWGKDSHLHRGQGLSDSIRSTLCLAEEHSLSITWLLRYEVLGLPWFIPVFHFKFICNSVDFINSTQSYEPKERLHFLQNWGLNYQKGLNFLLQGSVGLSGTPLSLCLIFYLLYCFS